MSNSILSKSVLILNTNYSPMDICSAKRAICLFYNQKVEILESYREKVHSPSISLLLPSIIKLKNYVKNNNMEVILSRKNLLIRDNYQCQYCLSKKAPLTIDHIVPKNKGGEDSWANLVIACQNCNRKKGNKTLKQSNMNLNKSPRKPNKIQYFQKFIKSEQNSWKPYLFMESM